MPERFRDEVSKLLKESGWFEGRDVLDELVLPENFILFPAAERILREFGGLRVGTTGRGVDCGASDVNFDPSRGSMLLTNFEEESQIVGSLLYPIATFCLDNWYLLVAESGSIFLWGEDFVYYDSNFEEALTRLVLGLKQMPT